MTIERPAYHESGLGWMDDCSITTGAVPTSLGQFSRPTLVYMVVCLFVCFWSFSSIYLEVWDGGSTGVNLDDMEMQHFNLSINWYMERQRSIAISGEFRMNWKEMW